MKKRLLKLVLRIYTLLTLTYLGVALVSTLIFYLILPEEYFALYPSIDVFYWACGMGLNYFLNRNRNKGPDKLLNVYMVSRLAKFFLTVGFLIIGIMALDMPKMSFTISLMSNFLVYSFLELYVYHRYNKQFSASHGNASKR